jgi:hypothetical protein
VIHFKFPGYILSLNMKLACNNILHRFEPTFEVEVYTTVQLSGSMWIIADYTATVHRSNACGVLQR